MTILSSQGGQNLKNHENLPPHCDINDLILDPEGIIILSGSLFSLSGKLFLKNKLTDLIEFYALIQQNFKNSFYLEIQRHNDQNEKQFEQFNLNTSKKLNIPIIATHEVYYLDQSMHDAESRVG